MSFCDVFWPIMTPPPVGHQRTRGLGKNIYQCIFCSCCTGGIMQNLLSSFVRQTSNKFKHTERTLFQQKTSSNKLLNIVVHVWPEFRMNQEAAWDNYIDSKQPHVVEPVRHHNQPQACWVQERRTKGCLQKLLKQSLLSQMQPLSKKKIQQQVFEHCCSCLTEVQDE